MPYKGGAGDQRFDGGHANALSKSGAVAQQISGKLKALAVTGDKRAEALPES